MNSSNAKPSRWSAPTRPSSTERGYGHAWKVRRDRIMKRDGGLCQLCKQAGLLVLAQEVDHIVSRAAGGTDDDDNLRALCVPHHRAKTSDDSVRARGGTPRPTIGLDGWPIECGQPRPA